MKKIFALMLCLALAGTTAGTQLAAATSAKTYAAAQKRNSKDGVLVYCYGPDWNPRSVAMLKSLWESAEVKRAAGDAGMVAAPFYQHPSDKERNAAQEARKGLRMPLICGYPSILMVSQSGDTYYIITGNEIYAEKEAVAAKISEQLAHERERKELRSQADKAKGLDKAKLLGKIAETYGEPIFAEGDDKIACVDMGTLKRIRADLIKELKACDPKDETNFTKQLEFDLFKTFSEKTFPKSEKMTPDEAYDFVKKNVVGDEAAYRPAQRQKLIAACASYLRRKNKNDSRIPAMLRRIVKIDADNEWASFAREFDRIWLGGTALEKKKKND